MEIKEIKVFSFLPVSLAHSHHQESRNEEAIEEIFAKIDKSPEKPSNSKS